MPQSESEKRQLNAEQNNKQAQSEIQSFSYSLQDIERGSLYLRAKQAKVRNIYLQSQIQPYHFCSYLAFYKVFGKPNIYEAHKQENLNIIDVHLRYHQYVHEKMTPYKWVPSLLFSFITRFKLAGLIFPFVYIKLFDKYFQDFFLWKYSQSKIINIRDEFALKVAKEKSMLRRVLCFERIKNDLGKTTDQVPIKYIKFGQSSQYIFHTTIDNIQQSSIYLTPAFEWYMGIKNFSISSLKSFFQAFIALKNQFSEYKKIKNKEQLPSKHVLQSLLSYKDIKEEETYNLTKQIELRVRRALEIIKYEKTKKFFMSGFTFTDLLHLNKHYDLLSSQRFNFERNSGDFVLFYGTILLVKGASFIVKRSIRM